MAGQSWAEIPGRGPEKAKGGGVDFFSIQSRAKRKKALLLAVAAPATVLSALLIYLALTVCLALALAEGRFEGLPAFIYGSPPLILAARPILIVCGGLALLFLMAADYRTRAVRRGGGHYIAGILGAIPLEEPGNLAEKRFMTAVEEMSVAAGRPQPRLYLLPEEKMINSLTAGLGQRDAVIIVSRGALDYLTIDELRALAAHEFARLLNGDFALKFYARGWNGGMSVFYFIAMMIWFFLAMLVLSGALPLAIIRDGLSSSMASLLGFALVLTAGIWLAKAGPGAVLASLGRNDDDLADAFAAQFSRDPKSFAAVLKKAGGMAGVKLSPRWARPDLGRLLMVDPSAFDLPAPDDKPKLKFGEVLAEIIMLVSGFTEIFQSRRGLEERIKSLEPDWGGSFIKIRVVGPEDGFQEAEPPDGGGCGKRSSAGNYRLLIDKLRSAPQNWRGLLMTAMAAKGGGPGLGLSFRRALGRPLEAFVRFRPNWPEGVRQAALRTERVSALVCAVLLGDDAAARAGQLRIIESALGRAAAADSARLWSELEPELRLPALDLAYPALMGLPVSVRFQLGKVLKELVSADRRVDYFELAVLMRLNKPLSLGPIFTAPGDSPPASAGSRVEWRPGLERSEAGISKIGADSLTALSALAYLGGGGLKKAEAAFNAGLSFLGPEIGRPELAAKPGGLEIAQVLESLGGAPLKIRKDLLLAATAVCLDDGQISREEYLLAYALAAALNMAPAAPGDPREPRFPKAELVPPLFQPGLLANLGFWGGLKMSGGGLVVISITALLFALDKGYSGRIPAALFFSGLMLLGLAEYIYPGGNRPEE